MTGPMDAELLTVATPYALYAVSAAERSDIEGRIAAASEEVAAAFREEVRAVRETMAAVSASTAVEPPPGLRDRVLAAVELRPGHGMRWRAAAFVAAAAAAAVIAFVAGLTLRASQPPPINEQVLAASDVHTANGVIASGGTATVVYSREKNAALLVMNNVAPPAAGTVYQMWLIEDEKPRSAGTMAPQSVHPSTTEVIGDLGNADMLAFTVEPGGGSEQPTGQIFVALPLS